MQMTLRWFGAKNDPIPLRYIKQIPGVVGVVPTLYDIPVGKAWPMADILAMKGEIEAAGLKASAIESVNIHEDIKLGLPSRDEYIDNYIATIRNLGKAGIPVICYNFMPVFDWTRSNLALPLEDGSTALSYDENQVTSRTPEEIFQAIERESNGNVQPGWEPERLTDIKKLFAMYDGMTEDDLFANLGYFLRAVVPECEKAGVSMAIHPDDPPWPVFGLPRIVTSEANLARLLSLVDSPANGLTVCTGSLGANPQNDLPTIMRRFGAMGRIHFVHLRNIRITAPGVFHEVAHLTEAGSLDIFAIVKALHDVGFTGVLRPDHGRMIWDEIGRPGYGLFDRALGAAYINGLWEAMEKLK